jgi:hypothetical protein
MKRFNDWLAIKITSGVATMWCAYCFAVLAILGFPYSQMTPQLLVQWISQTFIQLTMLSIIMVGQNLQMKQSKTHHEELKQHIKKSKEK